MQKKEYFVPVDNTNKSNYVIITIWSKNIWIKKDKYLSANICAHINIYFNHYTYSEFSIIRT